jgi:hypothetical protein
MAVTDQDPRRCKADSVGGTRNADDGHGRLESIVGHPRRAPAYPDAGVVDERVERAVRTDLVGEPVHLFEFGQVPRDQRRLAAELFHNWTAPIPTFAVNVLAPHLLTSLLAAELRGRLLWLGSSSANFGRPDPATLGRPQEPSRAYSDSKACDVALALAWRRRLPSVASAAVDPSWVKTKLASAGAPGSVTSSADALAYCCIEADLAAAPYWKDRAATTVPRHLQDEALQDAIVSACDRLARID